MALTFSEPDGSPIPRSADSIVQSNIRIRDMLEVHSVYATVRLPSDDDTGQITIGYFTRADDVLTMTNPKGVLVRRPITGEKI